VEQAIGPGTQFGITCAIQVHPGQQAQVLHYDQGIYPLPRDRDVMITALWALDDFTAGNGATRLVPGSHLRPAGKPDAAETVPAEMPAGSVLLFLGRLYHGAGANTTGRLRLGVVIDYVQPWLRPCEAHTLSASHEQVRQLPQRLQELLGFNQPTPYLGFVNGRHPRDWLMNDLGRQALEDHLAWLAQLDEAVSGGRAGNAGGPADAGGRTRATASATDSRPTSVP
jgi:ectoine hydroxylase-related dioxygenase (phytanoyl-CoA dioxygenase family)